MITNKHNKPCYDNGFVAHFCWPLFINRPIITPTDLYFKGISETQKDFVGKVKTIKPFNAISKTIKTFIGKVTNAST